MAKSQKAEPAPEKEKRRGVGDAAIEAIRAGKTNEQALNAVREEFPDAKTSLASINWYRNKLRSDGEKGDNGKKIPSARELIKQLKKEAAEF